MARPTAARLQTVQHACSLVASSHCSISQCCVCTHVCVRQFTPEPSYHAGKAPCNTIVFVGVVQGITHFTCHLTQEQCYTGATRMYYTSYSMHSRASMDK